jgi:hypothetical protein
MRGRTYTLSYYPSSRTLASAPSSKALDSLMKDSFDGLPICVLSDVYNVRISLPSRLHQWVFALAIITNVLCIGAEVPALMASMMNNKNDFIPSLLPIQSMFGADGYLLISVASDYSNRVSRTPFL